MPAFILTPDERAELDVVADEHRDAWIEHQEALAAAEGVGAEQPEGCDAFDPFEGLTSEPLTPAELDRAVRHDERRTYGVGR